MTLTQKTINAIELAVGFLRIAQNNIEIAETELTAIDVLHLKQMVNESIEEFIYL
jgi:hypothetical protein